jgi:hypothetical protein
MTAISPLQAHYILTEAKGVVLTESGTVADFLLFDIEQDPDNEWLRVLWRDGLGEENALVFPEKLIYLSGEDMILLDEDDEEVILTPLFSKTLD